MKNILKTIIFISLLLISSFFIKQKLNGEGHNKIKVLYMAQLERPKSFDPIKVNDIYSVEELSKIYEPLLEYEYLERPFKLKPNLLESIPTVSFDGLTYTLKLKKNIFFQDDPCFKNGKGREVQSKDIEFSIKRLSDKKFKGFGFDFIKEKIEGLDEWRNKYKTHKTNFDEPVKGLKIINKYSIRIKLKKRYPEFLDILVLHFFSLIPREAYEKYGDNFGIHPVGTGPFMLKGKYNPKSSKIVYIKNPKFRKEYFPSIGAKKYKNMINKYGRKKIPFIDKIVTHIIPDASIRWGKMKKGEIHLMDITKDGNLDNILTSSMELVNDLKEYGISVTKTSTATTLFFAFNNEHPLFKKNINLRKAIAMAFDRIEFNKKFFNNTAKIAQSIVPPGLSGYDPKYKNLQYLSNTNSKKEKAEIIKNAKDLLIKAGFFGNNRLPEINLDILSNEIDQKWANFFKVNMKKTLGIKINIIKNTLPQLNKKISERTCMMFRMGWSGDYPDGDNFLRMYYSPNISPGANHSNFCNQKYDLLYEESMLMRRSILRTMLHKKMNRMIAKFVPDVFINHLVHFTIYKNNLNNYVWSDYQYGTEKYLDIVNVQSV